MNVTPKIFISYRRSDSAGDAGRLYDHLSNEFGAKNIFKDVANILLGDNFIETINDFLEDCDVFILIIGKNFTKEKKEDGSIRISDPNDYIHIETTTAINLRKIIIPVIFEGASMPSKNILPTELKELSLYNGFSMSHSKWTQGIENLIAGIKNKIAQVEKSPKIKDQKLNNSNNTKAKLKPPELVTFNQPAFKYHYSNDSYYSSVFSLNELCVLYRKDKNSLVLNEIGKEKSNQLFELSGGSITSVALSKDSRFAVIGKKKESFFGKHSIQLIDLKNRKIIYTIDVRREPKNIIISPDSKHFAVYFLKGGIEIYEVESKKELYSIGSFIWAPIRMSFVYNSSIFLVGYLTTNGPGADGDLFIGVSAIDFDSKNSKFFRFSEEGTGLDFSFHGNHVVIGSRRILYIRKIDISTFLKPREDGIPRTNHPENVGSISLPGPHEYAYNSRIRKVIFSSDNLYCYISTHNNEIFIVKMNSKKLMYNIKFENHQFDDFIVSSNNGYLITKGNGKMNFWNFDKVFNFQTS